MAIDGAVCVRESDLPWVDIGVRPGYNQRYKGLFDKRRGLAARVGSLYAEPYYHSPRHRHTFQQVRYVVAGRMKYGRELYVAGDCLYLPEGIHYGPVKPLSEEDGPAEQLHFVDIQFMGPSGIPYPDPDDVVRAQRELTREGKFEEGVFYGANGHNRDAYEAILERVTGRKIEYPPERLTDYIVMRSPAYPWVPHPDHAGVKVKHLAALFEAGPNIKLVSLAPGATLPDATSPGHQIRYLLRGRTRCRNEEYEPISYFFAPMDEEMPQQTAVEEAEMLVITWAPNDRPGLPFTPF